MRGDAILARVCPDCLSEPGPRLYKSGSAVLIIGFRKYCWSWSGRDEWL